MFDSGPPHEEGTTEWLIVHVWVQKGYADKMITHVDLKYVINELRLMSEGEELDKFCNSLYLVGSYPRQEYDTKSDIDLIVFVSDATFITKVLEIIDTFSKKIHNLGQVVDTRIYTESGFREAYGGVDHFSLWSSINSGLLIIGEPIQAKLKLPLVISGITYWMDRVNESTALLEARSQFAGACFYLRSALVWFFFIEKYLYSEDKQTLSKRRILELYFDDMESTVGSCYEEVVKKSRKKLVTPKKGKIQVKRRVWSELDYSKLLDIAKRIMNYGDRICQKTSNRLGY
jgi:predicted nucleotidyltransferase